MWVGVSVAAGLSLLFWGVPLRPGVLDRQVSLQQSFGLWGHFGRASGLGQVGVGVGVGVAGQCATAAAAVAHPLGCCFLHRGRWPRTASLPL